MIIKEGDVTTYPSGRVRLKGKALSNLRIECFRRDNGRCCECGSKVSDMWTRWHPLRFEMAHIKSRGANGSDVLDNVRTLCRQCHVREHTQGKRP